MAAHLSETSRATRSYRSTKRPQPCDQCRERKLKCEIHHEPPCQRCRGDGTSCTFRRSSRRSARSLISNASPSSARSNRDAQYPQQPLSSLSPAHLHIFDNEEISIPSIPPHNSNGGSGEQPVASHDAALATAAVPFRPLTQSSLSLEDTEESTALFLGASSSSDPWLLRHCMFDQAGLHTFGNLRFRNAGGVPTIGKIPVQFIVSAACPSDQLTAETNTTEGFLRSEVEKLISIAQGTRLIRLFHKHIFPTLPIVSRTNLELPSPDSLPSRDVLTAMPAYLLAALYATALPFSSEDEELALDFAHNQRPQDELWRIVDELLQRKIHEPKLCVLQTALLYLHKSSQHGRAPDLRQTAYKWAFLSNIVGLAQNLGLHLECRMYAVPAWERRLRRRLWWATYIEDKWTSLLLGRPPHIQHDECDVSDLSDTDFTRQGAPDAEGCQAFIDLSRLALIARTLQSSLYSLRACQILAEDPVALLQVAKPIFDELNAWRAQASAPEPFHPESHFETGNYPITVHFAYLTLGLYVWRALIRSSAVSLPPPFVIDADEQPPQEIMQSNGTLLDFLNIDLDAFPNIDLPNFEWSSSDATTNSNMLARELYQAAQSWAEYLVDFVWQMAFHKVEEFWHSWSRFSFTVASTFLITLLVQAPSLQEALKAKQLLAKWRRAINSRSKVSDLFSLAQTQLNTLGADVKSSYYVPDHVQQALVQDGNTFQPL